VVVEEDWSEVVQRTLQVLLASLVQEYTYCFTSTKVRILVEEEDWSEVVHRTLLVLVADIVAIGLSCSYCCMSGVCMLLYIQRPHTAIYLPRAAAACEARAGSLVQRVLILLALLVQKYEY
jgi:hypothetical protein